MEASYIPWHLDPFADLDPFVLAFEDLDLLVLVLVDLNPLEAVNCSKELSE